MKNSRKRATRRDRRKAKASDWRRQGKTKMGVVGHGPNAGSTHEVITKAARRELGVDVGPAFPLRFRPLAGLAAALVAAKHQHQRPGEQEEQRRVGDHGGLDVGSPVVPQHSRT